MSESNIRKHSLSSTCQKCGGVCPADAIVCPQCGWHIPPREALATPCPLCHQSKYFDSLTMRCAHCSPIQFSDMHPELEGYARRARVKRYKVTMGLILISLIFIIIYTFSDRGGLLFVLLIAAAILPIVAVLLFIRSRNYLLGYYRLGWVIGNVKPVDAELKYKVVSTGKGGASYYFYICRVAPAAFWPTSLKDKMRIDPPLSEYEKMVDNHSFMGENNPLWGKVYFDPDESGNAVIRIANSIFVSVKNSPLVS